MACRSRGGLARAERAENEYYPLDTKDGSDLFDILSGPHIADGLRKRVGEFLFKRGFFETPEFRRAEERLATWPSSPWYKEEVTPPGCHEQLFARWRDPIVCMSDTFHNPELNPETDCVWGPEVIRDEVTRASEDYGRGYISEVFHGEWCALRRAYPPLQPERGAHARVASPTKLFYNSKTCCIKVKSVLSRLVPFCNDSTARRGARAG